MNAVIREVEVALQYLANDQDLAIYIASSAGGEVIPHEGNYVMQKMRVSNGRLTNKAYDLDNHGFTIDHHKTEVTDFFDDKQISDIYNIEISKLVKKTTGARSVAVFDNTRRATSDAIRRSKNVREPANIIHNDYTELSATKRVRDLFPEDAESLLQNRFAIINVWQSIAGTVENFPLAMCDASSVQQNDLVAVKRQSVDRIGEIQLAVHNPNHQWVYFPGMKKDEVLLFKTFDSATDGRARYTIHSSFDDPNATKDAAARESIETRCFVFY